MADREQVLKGRRAKCGHLVAKGRWVHDGRCFDCAARISAAVVLGKSPAVFSGGSCSITALPTTSTTANVHWRFGRA